MDRREEFMEAAKSVFALHLPEGFDSASTQGLLDDLRNAFVLGAMWADAHPSIDICVKDENVEDLDITEQ